MEKQKLKWNRVSVLKEKEEVSLIDFVPLLGKKLRTKFLGTIRTRLSNIEITLFVQKEIESFCDDLYYKGKNIS